MCRRRLEPYPETISEGKWRRDFFFFLQSSCEMEHSQVQLPGQDGRISGIVSEWVELSKWDEIKPIYETKEAVIKVNEWVLV